MQIKCKQSLCFYLIYYQSMEILSSLFSCEHFQQCLIFCLQYFPPSIAGWCVYCSLVSILFGFIKLLNYALHHMYDTTECIIVPPDNTAPPEKRRMQKRHK